LESGRFPMIRLCRQPNIEMHHARHCKLGCRKSRDAAATTNIVAKRHRSRLRDRSSRVGSFGDGGQVQQPDALDHHRRCHAEYRCLIDQALPMASHRLNLGSNARDPHSPECGTSLRFPSVIVRAAQNCDCQVSSAGRPYLGATNWPCSQRIVASDCIGSPSFTAVLSTCEQRGHSKVRRS
jgi:hypothetical protein